jgi:hypothetical protein
MPSISPELQKIMDDFATRDLGGTASVEAVNLNDAINSSPLLVERMNLAVSQGYLKNMALNTDVNAGASYQANGQTMNLGKSVLKSATNGSPQAQGNLVFQIGHENQHAFNAWAPAPEGFANAASQQFNQQIGAISASPNVVHDYSAALGSQLDADRRDEAVAEIGGWNALASRVAAQTHGTPSLGQMYAESGYAADFVTKDKATNLYTLKPNLSINPDMTLAASAQNVEAMGQNYFDKNGQQARLGDGHSDYRNSYATFYLSQIHANEDLQLKAYQASHHGHSPKVVMDTAGLGLKEDQIERNGLNLTYTTDNGRVRHGNDQTRMSYYNTAGSVVEHHFDHTASGANKGTYVPIILNDAANKTPEPSANPSQPEPLAPNADARAMFAHLLNAARSDQPDAMMGAMNQLSQTDFAQQRQAQDLQSLQQQQATEREQALAQKQAQELAAQQEREQPQVMQQQHEPHSRAMVR